MEWKRDEFFLAFAEIFQREIIVVVVVVESLWMKIGRRLFKGRWKMEIGRTRADFEAIWVDSLEGAICQTL